MSSPTPLNYLTPSGGPNLREIASRQRAIILCLLGNIVIIVLEFSIPPNLRIFLGLPALAVYITTVVFVFMLATKVYSTGTGIIMGLLTLIPYMASSPC